MSKVFLFVEIEVRPNKVDSFLKILKNQIEVIRVEAGCEEIEIFTNASNGNLVHVWEVWSNRKLWDAHMANEASKAWQDIASAFVLGEKITIMNQF